MANTVSVSLSQASRANIGAAASDTTVITKHASSVQMNGSSFDLTLNADDASVATFKEFAVSDTASVTLSDASEAWVNITGTLNIHVTGASTLYYRGLPTLGSFTPGFFCTRRRRPLLHGIEDLGVWLFLIHQSTLYSRDFMRNGFRKEDRYSRQPVHPFEILAGNSFIMSDRLKKVNIGL